MSFNALPYSPFRKFPSAPRAPRPAPHRGSTWFRFPRSTNKSVSESGCWRALLHGRASLTHAGCPCQQPANPAVPAGSRDGGRGWGCLPAGMLQGSPQGRNSSGGAVHSWVALPRQLALPPSQGYVPLGVQDRQASTPGTAPKRFFWELLQLIAQCCSISCKASRATFSPKQGPGKQKSLPGSPHFSQLLSSHCEKRVFLVNESRD